MTREFIHFSRTWGQILSIRVVEWYLSMIFVLNKHYDSSDGVVLDDELTDNSGRRTLATALDRSEYRMTVPCQGFRTRISR